MSSNLAIYTCPKQEDYIDMELTTSSPSKDTQEFEFQMSSLSCNDQKTHGNNTTSPADDLFYKGKLLPLHLPPRQLLVESLRLEITGMPFVEYHHYAPSDSGRVSCDRNPDRDHRFLSFSDDLSRPADDQRPVKKLWSEKLKLITQSSVLGKKLRASSAYLKALFAKPVCSQETYRDVGSENLSKGEAPLGKYMKFSKKQSFGRNFSRNSCPRISTFNEDISNVSRRSFSGPVKWRSSSDSSSSSSSFKSNGQCELIFLRRSSSVDEIEASIGAAIAHCKKSMQMFHAINLDEDEKNAMSLW